MGTRASLVNAIVVHGRLFGLLVLHDARPAFVCYDVRQGTALFAESVSQAIEGRLEESKRIAEARAREFHSRVRKCTQMRSWA
eukprot:tig00021070_g17886.t1